MTALRGHHFTLRCLGKKKSNPTLVRTQDDGNRIHGWWEWTCFGESLTVTLKMQRSGTQKLLFSLLYQAGSRQETARQSPEVLEQSCAFRVRDLAIIEQLPGCSRALVETESLTAGQRVATRLDCPS